MIQIGYFNEFKGAPAVVLAADAVDFDRLAEALLSVARQGGDLIAALRGSGREVNLVNVSSFKVKAHAIGTRLSPNGPSLLCEVSDAYATRLDGLISALKEKASSGHQYLESGSPNLQFILSKDEYSKPLG